MDPLKNATVEGQRSPTKVASASLPAHADRFMGRTEVLMTLIDCFSGGHRLVTLTGFPGVGKSRVAQQMTRLVCNEASKGRGFLYIDAARLQSASDVRARLDSFFDQASDGCALSLLSVRPWLLLLDNFEELAHSTGPIIQNWLESCPDLWVLITSRIPLEIPGERLVELAPLATPTPGHPLADLKYNPAVSFFVERAQAVDPRFVLTEENAEDIVQIVSALDGLPLALELASARISVMRPSSLRSRLDKRFQWLRRRKGDEEARDSSMKAAIDRSWALLSEVEQSALAQCANFQGSFSLDDAEALIDLSETPDAPWVLDVLGSLAGKSLITTHRVDEHNEFKLLETVRHYLIDNIRFEMNT